MKFFSTGTLFKLLICLLTIIGFFEDLIDETLDLMGLKTLEMTLTNLRTKSDCR